MNGTDIGPVEIPLWIDLMAVFVAGLAAALLASKKELDVTGVFFLAIVGALGGGIIRDTLIQRGTPAALDKSSYLITAIIAAIIGFMFATQIRHVRWALTGIDALSLGLYTLVGVLKGLDAGLPTLSVILLGVLSAVGGGMLRDVLLVRTPEALLPGAPYAILSIVGAVLVVVVDQVGTSQEFFWWLPVAIVVLLRFVTLRLGWETPAAARVEAQVGAIVPAGPLPQQVMVITPAKVIPRLRRRARRYRKTQEDIGD
jgi:uncharacterized membrane protein YeiH